MFFFTYVNAVRASGDLIGLLYWRAYFYSSNKEFDPQNLNIKEHGDVLESLSRSEGRYSRPNQD